MPIYKKPTHDNPKSNSDEKHYHTLDKIDLSDIAQAIDGGRSSKEVDKDFNSHKKNQVREDLKGKKFWFW